SEAGMTRFNFCRRFQKECGITPMRWLWTFRTLLAGEFIRLDPRWSLTDVAFACGFTSSAHFSRSFKQTFGKTPSQFRKETLVETAPEGDGHDIMFSDNVAVAGRAALAALV